MFPIFHKKKSTAGAASGVERKIYDPSEMKPILHCSICNGEQVAGFKDRKSGHFEEIMLIRSEEDLEAFRSEYGITGQIEKEY